MSNDDGTAHQSDGRGPASDDSDVGEELRHEVERTGSDGERDGEAAPELDEPAFTQDDGAMDVPPPG